MTILAIDTATRSMGLALYQPDHVLYERTWESDNFHTVELAPTIKEVLAQTGLTKKKISAIALAIGPGSYTGLRIGLALAKGMAFSLNIPVVPIPTLDILASGQPLDDLPLLALIQAGRGKFSIAQYEAQDGKWIRMQEAYPSTIEQLYDAIKSPSIICGELSAKDRKKLAHKKTNAILATPAQCVRRPAILAELANSALLENRDFPILGLTPDYMKSESFQAS